MSHDNAMTITHFGDEMTLKATLFVCISIVISKALVSCIIDPEEILQPSMTFMIIGVLFFTRITLYCHTNFLSMKHINAP
jgi:hypothetical protein